MLVLVDERTGMGRTRNLSFEQGSEAARVAERSVRCQGFVLHENAVSVVEA